MKAIATLPREPAELAAYTAENPQDAAASGPDAGSAWNRFRDDPRYAKVRDELLSIQNGLCFYCENRLLSDDGKLIRADQQVEHVQAKAGGVGRVLDWRNLVVCCVGGINPHAQDSARRYDGKTNVSCGQAKGEDDLGMGCDPRAWPFPSRLVDIAIDGRISPNIPACQAAGVSEAELRRTIEEVLNLNCERLRVARQSVVRKATDEFIWLATELTSRVWPDPSLQDRFFDVLVEGRLAPDPYGYLRRFWTAEQQYLEPWSTVWLSKNGALFQPTATP